MNRLYVLAFAFVMVLASGEAALAAEAEHSLPWGDFLLRVVNAAIFLWILWKAAGKIVTKFFTDRRSGIIREMDDLAQRKRDAEARLAEVERQIANVEEECRQLLESGRVQAERMKASIVADAEAHAARIIADAVRNAEMEGQAELDAVRRRMADVIVPELERRLLEKLDAGAHQRLIDKSLAKVVM